jgi:hypothetical protein
MKLSTILPSVGFLFLILILKYVSSRGSASSVSSKKVYHYRAKSSLMTNAENEFFNMLMDAIGARYFVFPQVHLSAILDHNVKGQNWKAAFRSINGKSVDYVICDKTSRKPLIAIELDDYTHNAEDRKQRDIEVERILGEARIHLLRFTNYKTISRDEIRRQIAETLFSSNL